MIRIVRVRCRVCAVTQALLPWFVVPFRWDVVDVIGQALEMSATGAGVRKIAAAVGRPETTVRRRFWRLAGALAAAILALAVSWGWSGWELPTGPKARGLAAVEAAAGEWGRRYGAGRRWRIADLITGGRLLARNTTSLLAVSSAWSWMAGNPNQEVPNGP